MGRLKTPRHRQRGGTLHLMSEVVGLGLSEPFVFCQRLIKTLMPRQGGDVVRARHMKLRRQLETALQQQQCLTDGANRNTHLSQ